MIPIITTRSYEIVRDRIATILASELSSQSALHNDANLNAGVFIDRIVPIDSNETPIVNIIMGTAGWDNFTPIKQDGTYVYDIDVYVGSKGSATERGDVLSMNKLQKLAGVIQGILMHPNYITLGFARPFIEHREVNSASLGVPNNTLDATNTTQCRLQLLVRVPEHSTVETPPNIEGWDTSVKLGLTDKGYIYSGDNIPIPDPVCEVLTFVYNTDNTLLVSKLVNANDNTITVDDSDISVNGNLLKSLPATNDLDINLINTDGDAIENFTILPSGDVELDEFRVANSDDSFEEYYAINDNGAILNDVDNIDTDGTVVPTPAQTPFTCSAPDNTILNLNFLDTASTVEFKGDSLNAGIYRADACGLDSTEISVSTDDGTTFTPLTFPFTIVDGVDYIFMRSVSDITNQFNSFRIIPNLNSYDSVSSIVQRGLILDLDGRNTASYNGIGTVWTDVVNGHTFDLINNPAFVNKCFVFNGVDNYAPANPDDFEIDETQPFTINAVVNIDDVSFSSRLATLGTFKTASYDQAIKIFYSEISTFRGVNFCINSSFTFRTNVNLTKGVNNLIQLKYIGGSITSSFSYELRVNNVLVSATTSSLTYKAGNTTIIGSDDRLLSNVGFDGSMCRVFVNEVETTTAEDLFNYNLLDTVYNFGV